jgi:hypothetical protein
MLTQLSSASQVDRIHDSDQSDRRLYRSPRRSPSLQPRNEYYQEEQDCRSIRTSARVQFSQPTSREHSLILNRAIPISMIRVIRLSHALQSDTYNFDYVSVEVLTQAEMCYNVLAATLPSLSMFLASAHTGLLELGGTDKMTSTYGSASRRNGTPRATLHSGNRKGNGVGSSREGGVEAFELAEQSHCGTSSAVTSEKVQRDSLASDDSERAIIRVERTVSLRYER